MSNLRKLALSHENIAKVHVNRQTAYNNDPITRSAITKSSKPHWKLRKHSRFANNLTNARTDGNIDSIIEAVGNSSPFYNNTLRNEHMVLLMAAQSVLTFSTLARYSNGAIYILKAYQLIEEIPHIPGIKSRRAFLSYKGFQLLDHWNKKYKRFQPYYNAFVNEDIRGKAKEYSVIRAIGGVHKDIKEVAEINTEMDRKIIKREKTFKMQRTLQDSIRKEAHTFFTTGPVTSTAVPITSITPGNTYNSPTAFVTTGALQQNITTNTQTTLTILTNGLLGSLFGGK